ncbi:DUF2345 domain-containing protein [Klebsiella pneumoniae subsp. pneumoniae]|nr:DUF2345 domain-containing protein [Klebsiella pneumoniae subsp. pneumoniae]
MKLFAAKGKMEIQAQDDALEATAKKDITVTSVEGRVEITAAKELVVNCAGAYIRLSGGNIELGCPGNILLKSANVQKMGKADFRVPPLELLELKGSKSVLLSKIRRPVKLCHLPVTASPLKKARYSKAGQMLMGKRPAFIPHCLSQ